MEPLQQQQPTPGDDSGDEDDGGGGGEKAAENESKNDDEGDESETDVQTYGDELTQQQWGGEGTVITSTRIPGADDDGEQRKRQKNSKRQRRTHDAEQEYAGHVERFLRDLKGHMPSKKKKKQQEHNSRRRRRGGKHGAANVKGLGDTMADLKKTAQKVLARTAAQKGKAGGKRRR